MSFINTLKTSVAVTVILGSLAFGGYSQVEAQNRTASADQKVTAVNSELAAKQAALAEFEALKADLERQLARTRAEREALAKKNETLKAENGRLLQKVRGYETSAPATPAVGFSDIGGLFAEKTVQALAEAGIFERTSGEFRPHDTITRAEFMRWLVRTTNALAPADQTIRLAEAGEVTFKDVPVDHPDYRYIQGAANAGFVIGYDETTFRPDRPLSREEMIAIKVNFDQADAQMNGNCYDLYTDFDEVSPKYKQAVHNRDNSGYGSGNARRIWGTLRTFYPQKQVTRAEAALCVSVIHIDGWPGRVSIADAR